MDPQSSHPQNIHAALAHDLTGNHIMAGIPDWLYYASIVIVMLLSLVILEWADRRKSERIRKNHRFDLGSIRIVRIAIGSRVLQFFVQFVILALFGLVLYAGFYGYQHPGNNIAPSLTWNIWWIGLIFAVFFFGKIWCYGCPWDALTSWLRRFTIFSRGSEIVNLGLPWPAMLKNIYPATIFFIVLTWLELGFHVTVSPEKTACLGLLMFALVFLPGLLFEKKAFCRYGCLVGRISGLYALFSPIEVRRRDKTICAACSTADCFRGNDNGYPCPTGQYLKTMQVNTYCTMCGECFRSCPHDNVCLNLRPFGADLTAIVKPRRDEAHLALILFSFTVFHGFTMTPHWKNLLNWLQIQLQIGRTSAFTIGMIVFTLLPLPLYYLAVWLSKTTAHRSLHAYKELTIHYAYALIPIALFYHIAHNLEHFLMESQKLVILASDPFGFGWDIFATINTQVKPLASLDLIWIIQALLIIVGHVYSIAICHKQANDLYPTGKSTMISQIPLIALMIGYSVLSLWLIAQPMEMRTAM